MVRFIDPIIDHVENNAKIMCPNYHNDNKSSESVDVTALIISFYDHKDLLVNDICIVYFTDKE